MYFIMEIQSLADGSCAHLVTTAESRGPAEAEYHRILAAAATSALPLHSAALLDATGAALRHECYAHGAEEVG